MSTNNSEEPQRVPYKGPRTRGEYEEYWERKGIRPTKEQWLQARDHWEAIARARLYNYHYIHLQQRCNEQLEDVENLREELRRNNIQINQLREENNQLKRQNRRLLIQLGRKDDNITDLEREITDLEHELEELNERYDDLEEEFVQYQIEKEDLIEEKDNNLMELIDLED